jgi:hypothetical protein
MRDLMTKIFRVAIFIAFIFSAKGTFATCHAVSPSGSGNHSGADWNNAMANLPGTLLRGDIYYLADGNYGGGDFSTPNSGTTITEVRKAQSYDNGSSCSPSIAAGWNTGTMGSAQAVFTSFTVGTDYVIVNGNGTQTTVGCGGAPGSTVTSAPPVPSDCGIKFTNTGANGVVFLEGTHATFQYYELIGTGVNIVDTNEFLGGPTPGQGGYTTIAHGYLHNAGCNYIQYGGSNTIVHHNYFWGTETDGAPSGNPCHGQAHEYSMGDSNGQVYSNVYRDIRGTAVFSFIIGPGTDAQANWSFYDNIFFNSSPYPSWQPAVTTGGIIGCMNSGVTCKGFQFYQNTIVNLGFGTGSLGSGQVGFDICNDVTSCSATVSNNLWYSNGTTPVFTCGSGCTYAQDHNSVLNSGSSCASGTANVCNNSSGNPFVNWQAGNFTLASDNANWANHLALSAPYNMDAAGNVFTTDRGAYQYNGVTATQPQPPTNLLATVQ